MTYSIIIYGKNDFKYTLTNYVKYIIFLYVETNNIKGINNMTNEVVRVALTNNFNCSFKEFKQLDKIANNNPESKFFVNSNIKTSKLRYVNYHDYNIVVTVNPDLIPDNDYLSKLYAIKDKVSFVRVKWLPNNIEIQQLIKKLSKSFNVVITVQQFNSWLSLSKFTDGKYYELSFGKLRLKEKYYREVCRFADSLKKVYICDRNHIGCGGCNLCSILNGEKKETPLQSLNLSSSGICKFNCADCFAKIMQNFISKCGRNPIEYNVIKKNKKQLGVNKFNLAHKK
jgi:hypothetical protein